MPLIRYLSIAEMEAILNAPDLRTRSGIRDRAMLHLGFAAGLRVSELTGLLLTGVTLQPTPGEDFMGFGETIRVEHQPDDDLFAVGSGVARIICTRTFQIMFDIHLARIASSPRTSLTFTVWFIPHVKGSGTCAQQYRRHRLIVNQRPLAHL